MAKAANKLGARREGTGIFVLVLMMAALFGAWLLVGFKPRAKLQVAQEDAALAALKSLLELERNHRTEHGHFTDVEGLLEAGLEGVALSREDDAGGAYLAGSGYRIDILLPYKREAGPRVRVARPSAQRPDGELARHHVVLVARPLEPGHSGFRTYALDESDLVWVCEGVSDANILASNPLPDTHLSSTRLADQSGRLWHRLDLLVPYGVPDEKK